MITFLTYLLGLNTDEKYFDVLMIISSLLDLSFQLYLISLI